MKKKIIYLFLALFIASGGSEKTTGTSTDGSKEAGTVSVTSPKVTVQSILSRMDRGKYKEGEILVKFRSGVVATQALKTHQAVGASVLTRFNIVPNLKHVKLPEEMSVKNAIINYMSDPNVEYAEPNYIVSITATPKDTYFSQLWGLQNTGQTVNGTAGTADADIDGLEAWDVQTGSSSVVIAVIDTGVDYNHPDLSANIWTNTGETSCTDGIDNDGNGYVDDCRGWDFYNNDNNPMDDNSHGTHVAGTIAAVGNNGVGIVGVNWTAKIMPLKFLSGLGSGSTSDAILAIQYANNKGAHIHNNSWSGSGFSQSLKDAIDASSAVVVAAAGNDGTNNDTTPVYPCSYTSSHIICVAATDQNDNLASFSNYGATSVDVGAPGVNIYSAKPGRQTVWSDNFDDGLISDWTTGGTNNTWNVTTLQKSSGTHSLTDSPSANYQNNTNSWARSPVINLSSHSATMLTFKLRGQSESDFDILYVEGSADLSTWTPLAIGIGADIYSGISGTTSGSWVSASVALGPYDGRSTVYIRFRFVTNSSVVYDGWYIDDVTVTSATVSDTYQFLDGTSMAAPYVAGLAGLIKARDSTLTNLQIKDIILNNVDSKASLSGKVLTGGRINAQNALGFPAPPSGLSGSASSASEIALSWTDNSSNETGFKIERKTGAGGTYSEIATVSANVTTYTNTGLSEATTYYYQVRAYNAAGNSSYSSEASATTPAAPLSSGSGGGGGGGGCFIATAAYGSYLAPEVMALREFRDKYLITNTMGRMFVEFYYSVSPPAAEYISRHEGLRTVTRLALTPIVYGIKYPFITLGMGFFAVVFLFYERKQQARKKIIC